MRSRAMQSDSESESSSESESDYGEDNPYSVPGNGMLEIKEIILKEHWCKRWATVERGRLGIFRMMIKPPVGCPPNVKIALYEGSTKIVCVENKDSHAGRWIFDITTADESGVRRWHTLSCRSAEERESWIKQIMIGFTATPVVYDKQLSIFKAAQQGDMCALDRMVQEEEADINQANVYGDTPLHYAVRAAVNAAGKGPIAEHRRMMVKVMLEWGADSTLKNGKELTSINYAQTWCVDHSYLKRQCAACLSKGGDDAVYTILRQKRDEIEKAAAELRAKEHHQQMVERNAKLAAIRKGAQKPAHGSKKPKEQRDRAGRGKPGDNNPHNPFGSCPDAEARRRRDELEEAKPRLSAKQLLMAGKGSEEAREMAKTYQKGEVTASAELEKDTFWDGHGDRPSGGSGAGAGPGSPGGRKTPKPPGPGNMGMPVPNWQRKKQAAEKLEEVKRICRRETPSRTPDIAYELYMKVHGDDQDCMHRWGKVKKQRDDKAEWQRRTREESESRQQRDAEADERARRQKVEAEQLNKSKNARAKGKGGGKQKKPPRPR